MRAATKFRTPQAQNRHVAGAGPHGVALAPPAYGLDIVDRAPAGEGPLQLRPAPVYAPVQRQASATLPHCTGLPDTLKAGAERLSGVSLDHVRVHYNSSRPAQLSALALTQGHDIHIAPGQEHYVPHEAWHVVQQAQGRVQPTMQRQGGVPINDDQGLEREADVMGVKALAKTAHFHDATTPVQAAGLDRHGRHKATPASLRKHVDRGEAEQVGQQAASGIAPVQAARAPAVPVIQLGRGSHHENQGRMVRKLEFVGSGGGLKWRRLIDKDPLPQAIQDPNTGAEYSVRDGKNGEPSQTYTIAGTDSHALKDVRMSGHGFRDVGSNTIANNVDLGMELIDGFVVEANQAQQQLVVLIKGHSRGGVAASRVAKAARAKYPAITVEAVFFDPVPGPDHSGEDVDIAVDPLGPLDQDTLVYSIDAKRSDAFMLPQKVTGVKRLILSRKSHSVSIRAGFLFGNSVYRNYSINCLPEGVYRSTGEIVHDAPEEIAQCNTLRDAMAAVEGERGLGVFESGRLDIIERVVKTMFPAQQVQAYEASKRAVTRNLVTYSGWRR